MVAHDIVDDAVSCPINGELELVGLDPGGMVALQAALLNCCLP